MNHRVIGSPEDDGWIATIEAWGPYVPSKYVRTYREFKLNFIKERYLTTIQNVDLRNIMCRFRLGVLKLRIETGGHSNLPLKTEPVYCVKMTK